MNDFEVEIEKAGYGQLVIVPHLTFTVSGGELLVVLGSNGAGKTTSLCSVVGTVDVSKRSIALDGEDFSSLEVWQFARSGIAFVPDGARCFESTSVIGNLRGALWAVRPSASSAVQKRLMAEIFDLFPVLESRLSQPAGSLSGGQRQMLAIARALIIKPRVLILDEPSAGLAPKVVEDLFEVLGRIKAENGCAIVMAEQNVGFAMEIADRCLVLEEGHVALQGKAADVRDNEQLRVAYLGL